MPLDLQISRTDPSHRQIELYVRKQIQLGTLKTGERLPTNMELARRWGVSCTAVQKALASLTTEGLLARAPRRGTYVRRLSEKANIGVLFGPTLSEETAYFYRSILKKLRLEIDDRNSTCRAYDGLSSVAEGSEAHQTQVRKQLMSDLRNYSFQGLIEFSPDMKWPQEVDAVARLPKASWSATQHKTDCSFDAYQFGQDSVRFLAGLGHKRLAFLRTSWHLAQHSDDLDGFLDAIKALGLPEPQIEQLVFTALGHDKEREMEEKTERLIREWTTGSNGRQWPEAILVNDDIIMRGVALALIRNGVQVPSRVRVLSFASEGVNLHYGIPVVRFEFPTSLVACHLTDLLWKRMQGEPEPELPILVRGKIQNPN